jgi:hypothetical protein
MSHAPEMFGAFLFFTMWVSNRMNKPQPGLEPVIVPRYTAKLRGPVTLIATR